MSKEDANQQIAQLTAVIAAYIKSAAELDDRRAKETRALDEKRAKEAKELDERRAKEAKELDERRAKEAKELDERRAKAAQELDEKRANEAKELDARRAKADEQRAKAAADDTQNLKNTVEGLAKQVDKVTKQMEETNRRYGSTARNTGRVTEEKFFRALESQKRVGNTTFKSVEHNITCKDGKPNGRSAELDIVMHNGTYSLIIEVKYLCHLNDVDKFAKKMDKAYPYISKEFNNRTLLFGMAANTFNEDAVKYAHKHGMITFHPDGQKVRTDIPAHTLLHPDTSVV